MSIDFCIIFSISCRPSLVPSGRTAPSEASSSKGKRTISAGSRPLELLPATLRSRRNDVPTPCQDEQGGWKFDIGDRGAQACGCLFSKPSRDALTPGTASCYIALLFSPVLSRVQALARALEGNASLTALGLGHQRIMDKGVQAVGRGGGGGVHIMRRRSVACSAQALQEAVRKNHTVERIDLWGRYVRMTAAA